VPPAGPAGLLVTGAWVPVMAGACSMLCAVVKDGAGAWSLSAGSSVGKVALPDALKDCVEGTGAPAMAGSEENGSKSSGMRSRSESSTCQGSGSVSVGAPAPDEDAVGGAFKPPRWSAGSDGRVPGSAF
jgi:hypothetical protein